MNRAANDAVDSECEREGEARFVARSIREAEQRAVRQALDKAARKLESIRQIKGPADCRAFGDLSSDEDGWRDMPEGCRSLMRAAAKLVRSLSEDTGGRDP